MTTHLRTDLAARELDACRGLLLRATDADWNRPTPCEGWDVEALARHLAAVAWQQAEAFHRGAVGITEAPSWLAATGSRGDVLDLLAAARDHLGTAFHAVASTPAATVPLPFAPLPAPLAVDGVVLEYGVHHHDLERAFGIAGDVDLDPEVAGTVAALVPALVPLLAEKPPATPIGYRLVGDTASVAITWHDGAWHGGEEDGVPVCEIAGSDAAIALLALGRIRGDHPALQTADDATAARIGDHIRTL